MSARTNGSDRAEAALELSGIEVRYGHATAVEPFSLVLPKGGCIGVVGANGAGKSSLFRCVAGLQRPSGGSIYVAGTRVTRMNAWTLARHGVRFVPETRELFWNLSVEDNLRLGGYRHSDKSEGLDLAIEVFPVLEELWKRPARLLSGGEQQMLAIARALLGRPRVLMLDEPSLGLAPIMVVQLIRSLKRIRETGVSMLVAEQNLRVPRELCDTVIVMRLGKVMIKGSVADTLDHDVLHRAFLGV